MAAEAELACALEAESQRGAQEVALWMHEVTVARCFSAACQRAVLVTLDEQAQSDSAVQLAAVQVVEPLG